MAGQWNFGGRPPSVISELAWKMLLVLYAALAVGCLVVSWLVLDVAEGFLIAALAVLALLLATLRQGAIYVAGHEIEYSKRPRLFRYFLAAYLLIGTVFALLAFR